MFPRGINTTDNPILIQIGENDFWHLLLFNHIRRHYPREVFMRIIGLCICIGSGFTRWLTRLWTCPDRFVVLVTDLIFSTYHRLCYIQGRKEERAILKEMFVLTLGFLTETGDGTSTEGFRFTLASQTVESPVQLRFILALIWSLIDNFSSKLWTV